MEKVKFIINPSSGRERMEPKIDRLAKMLLDNGYIVAKFFTEKKDDAKEETLKTCREDWDIIIVCGGDGTVNEVATGIALSKSKISVLIMAGGTVNDFANHMEIPDRTPELFEMIKNKKTVDVDLGQLGEDRYFVNVAAGGLLTEVAYQVPIEAKAVLGRMAYYFEGLREIISRDIEPIKVSFKSEEYTSEDEILLFLITNSSSIGGFKRVAPEADVLDNLLDVLIIKDSDMPEIANIFFSVLRGEHTRHPNVVYFKTEAIEIKSEKELPIDIDGEYGGELPEIFKVVPNGMRLIIK